MAKVKVGSARIDENGKTHGGAAGDQTGKEVATQSWYLHGKGWRVLRHKDRGAAKRAAEAMLAACANENVGYDQYERDTLMTAAEKTAYDISKVSTKCETDCSALIRVCEAFAFGEDIVGKVSSARFYTGNMVKILLSTGLFYELEGTKYTEQSDYLGMGDILVTKTKGHTVMAVTDGANYEGDAETAEYALGDRLLQKDAVGPDVKVLQEYLIKLGYDVGKYGADGEYGRDTMAAVANYQQDNGLTADGEYGEDTHAAMMAAVDRLEDAPTIEPAQGGSLTVIGDSKWNVRTGPGTAYAKAGLLEPGDTAQEVTLEGWKAILYKGEVRFVKAEAFEG